MKHQCPIPKCTEPKLIGHLLCFEHWYQVPADLREDIWQASRKHDIAVHEACCRKAIAHVTALDT